MMRQKLTKALAGLLLAGTAAMAATGYDWKSVVVGGGGFVDGFVFHPKVKGLMYSRTDMGGAYRWNPASSSWTPITDWIGSVSDDMGILSVALDPNDGSKVYLLSGKYSNAWSSEYGHVLVSKDTGKTFTSTTLHLKNGGNLDGRGTGERLAVDPNKGSILLLAGSAWDTSKDGTSKGTFKGALWMSTNSGVSFDSVATGPVGNGTFALFDPTSGSAGSATKTIYVGMDKSNAGAAALWRSKDGGASWAVVPGTPAGLIPSSGSISGSFLYVSFNNGLGPNGVTSGKLMRLNTTTDAWTDVSPVKSSTFGYGTPSIDLQTPSRMIVSSVDKWTGGDDVWLSRDNGETWTSTLLSGTLDNSFAPWKSTRSPHWLASVQIDPFDSTVALFGTGYGVYRTRDLLSAKPTWSAADSNLEETVAKQLVCHPSNAALFSAMGDQGGFRHLSLTKAPAAVHTPDVGTTLALEIAWANPAILVKAHNAANAAGTVGSISIDSGKTWTGFAKQPTGVSAASEANNWNGGGGIRSIAVNADGSSIVWTAMGSTGAFVSKDKGATWTASTGGTATAATATPVADRVNPLKMYVLDLGTGDVLASTDAGASFTAGGSTIKLDDWESGNSSIVTVPGYEGHLLVAGDHAWGGGGLYFSKNSASSFAKVSSVSSAFKVGVGKAAPGKTFPSVFIMGTVGGVSGFFRSDDSCKTWTRINDAQHQFGTIHHIVGDMNVYGRVFLGTEGRGIIYGEPTGTSLGIQTVASVAPARSSLLRTGNRLVSSQGLAIVLRDLSGRLVRQGSETSGLDLTGLPRGVYLARSASESLTVTILK